MPVTISLPATPPTFAEYQLIHQTQERLRYPAPQPKPATSDPWRQRLRLWLGAVGAAAGSWLIWPAQALAAVFFVTLFAGLGLVYQRWEYRQAYRRYQRLPQLLGLDLSAEGVTLELPAGRQRLAWATLYRVQQVGDWLLLYPGPDFCYYLDLRRLPPPHTAAEVLGWAQQAG